MDCLSKLQMEQATAPHWPRHGSPRAASLVLWLQNGNHPGYRERSERWTPEPM